MKDREREREGKRYIYIYIYKMKDFFLILKTFLILTATIK